MTDRYGHPTILEQKQSNRFNWHKPWAYTNCKNSLTGRRELPCTAQSLVKSKDMPKRVGTKKSVRPKATYRAAKRNQRRVVRTLQLEAKRHGRI